MAHIGDEAVKVIDDVVLLFFIAALNTTATLCSFLGDEFMFTQSLKKGFPRIRGLEGYMVIWHAGKESCVLFCISFLVMPKLVRLQYNIIQHGTVSPETLRPHVL